MFGNTVVASGGGGGGAIIVISLGVVAFLSLSSSNLWVSLVKAWADAFRSSPDLTGVVSVYEDLRRKGLEFPMTELDGYSPAQDPQKVRAAALTPSLPVISLVFFLSFSRVISVLLLASLRLGTGLLSLLCLPCSSLPNFRSSHR